MPRIARAVATGFPHHIVQRGNNKDTVFSDHEDKETYLSLLKKYSDKWKAPIAAYCLMSNHIHLLAKPENDESLHKMMQGVTLCYTQHINRKFGRTGRLWESRYHSCIVDTEQYLWAVARYIEQNPVRANMVTAPEDYPHSSAKAHFGYAIDKVLGEELFPESQRKDYIEFIRAKISEDQLKDIRYKTRTGRPFGSEAFIASVEDRLQRSFELKSAGRPKRAR